MYYSQARVYHNSVKSPLGRGEPIMARFSENGTYYGALLSLCLELRTRAIIGSTAILPQKSGKPRTKKQKNDLFLGEISFEIPT